MQLTIMHMAVIKTRACDRVHMIALTCFSLTASDSESHGSSEWNDSSMACSMPKWNVSAYFSMTAFPDARTIRIVLCAFELPVSGIDPH